MLCDWNLVLLDIKYIYFEIRLKELFCSREHDIDLYRPLFYVNVYVCIKLLPSNNSFIYVSMASYSIVRLECIDWKSGRGWGSSSVVVVEVLIGNFSKITVILRVVSVSFHKFWRVSGSNSEIPCNYSYLAWCLNTYPWSPPARTSRSHSKNIIL